MSTNRYLKQAAAGAAGGSTVPTGPVIGLECVCTFACLFNCACYNAANFMDIQGYAYGDKQWLYAYFGHYDGSNCVGTIGIMHYDDESCWARKTWSTNYAFGQGTKPFLYIHPISGWAFGAGTGLSGVAYINGGPDSSTNPNSFGIDSCLATTAAGGNCWFAAVGDTAAHQFSVSGGGNVSGAGVIFNCNYGPTVMGGYCDACCCFFYHTNTACLSIHIPRQCNGSGKPLETDAGIFAFCNAGQNVYRARGKATQFFTNENGNVFATQVMCRDGQSCCRLMVSSNAMCSWSTVAYETTTQGIDQGVYTGQQYIYNQTYCGLKAGSCCLCCPNNIDPVSADNYKVGATVLRDRVYIAICNTLYRGIQG